jgi:uncharacterized protein YjdB
VSPDNPTGKGLDQVIGADIVPALAGLRTTLRSLTVLRGTTLRIPVVRDPAPGAPAGKARVTWGSSAWKVATVKRGKSSGALTWPTNGTGKLAVRALKAGKTSITVRSGKAQLVLKVTVVTKQRAASRVKVTGRPKVLAVGQSVVLKARALPTRTTNAIARWKSSNARVARVDAAGRVTAIARGKTTITVSIRGRTAKTVITVR